MKKIIVLNDYNLEFNIETLKFSNEYSNTDVVKYFKGILGSVDRFVGDVIEKLLKPFNNGIEEFKIPDETINGLIEKFKEVKPFTYKEAFEITDDQFRIKVFESIDIVDMINNLGSKRLKTDGMEVKHKQYDDAGNFTGYKTYDVIYEVHEVSGEKLGLDDCSYALKCWCTSTNQEHFLWIEDKYKDNPLEAVASTFRVHKNLIPHIKEIKRQGDVLLLELTKNVKPEGEIVPLTAEQYFGFLTAQS